MDLRSHKHCDEPSGSVKAENSFCWIPVNCSWDTSHTWSWIWLDVFF